MAKMKLPDLIFPPEKSHSDEPAVSSPLHTRGLGDFTLRHAPDPFALSPDATTRRKQTSIT